MQKVKNLLHRNKDETTTTAPVAHTNPLDRNHDGRVDARDLTAQNTVLAPGMASTTTTTTTQQVLPVEPLVENRRLSQTIIEPVVERRLSQTLETTNLSSGAYSNVAGNRLSVTRAEPTVIETIQKDVVIQERIHPVEKEEIQPIIYREREQLDVKQVTQMMHETQIQPTLIEQRELPAERREAIIERGAPIVENFVAPSREVDATLRTQVVHAPIVNEVIKKTVIEEIQPVLERDIIQSTVIQNTQPIYEKIVEAPTVYREVRTVQERTIVGGDIAALEAQGFNLGATGRRLSQGYTAAPLASGLAMMNQGMLNQGVHHNPLDRNMDGRVDLNDLSGRQAPLAGEGLMTHRGLESTNPLDRNMDGKVDLADLSGRQNANTVNRPVNLL